MFVHVKVTSSGDACKCDIIEEQKGVCCLAQASAPTYVIASPKCIDKHKLRPQNPDLEETSQASSRW